jgi:hypothetical protein
MRGKYFYKFSLCAGEYSSLWVPVLCPAGQMVHHGGHDKEMTLHFLHNRGQILGRNPYKSLKSFPPFYSQSPLQLCLQIYLYFLKLTQPLIVSSGQLLYTIKKKGGKPDRKPYLLSYGLRNPSRNLKSKNSQNYAQKPQQNFTFMN